MDGSNNDSKTIDMPPAFKMESSFHGQDGEGFIRHRQNSSSTPSIVSIDDDESSQSSEHSQEEHLMQSGQQHRVRFSIVRTRSYNVVDELSMDDEPDMPPRRSLGWQYTERESDLETALAESLKERNEKYNRLIIEHMMRAEQLKAEQERIEEVKKKGWKLKAKRMFKSLGKGVLEATSKASFAVGTTPYG
eukprot:scaffold12065_cov73-Skeletonema_dohrnii-CCMP3373.AAC.1